MNSMSMVTSPRVLAQWALALVVVCGLPFGVSAWGDPVRTNYSTAELVAEQVSIPSDGGTVTVGVRLAPDPTWHAYWINPGDAGLPATGSQ